MRWIPLLLLTLASLAALPAMASAGHDHGNTIALELIPDTALEAGKPVQVTARLRTIRTGAPVTLDQLATAHTKKLHLLVIDPSLTDYHHLHPVAGKQPGDYVFTFTPHTADRYRVWADVMPKASGKQEYVRADMGQPAPETASIDTTTQLTSAVAGYQAVLQLESPLKVGEASMATVTVQKDDGEPVTTLQPLMGAFAHMVGFSGDYQSVLHVHPMGEEPATDAARGGPTLSFHIEPQKAGFVKLFVQLRINGQEVFLPFGVTVAR